MKRASIAVAFAFSIFATASAGRPDADALDRFDRTGEMRTCIAARSADITPIDDETFLFKVGTNDYYLNETRGACNDASSNFTRMEMKLFGSQICSGEIVRIVGQQSGIYQGSCSLGDFERLARKVEDASEGN